MTKELHIGDIVGIYEILGEGNLSKSGRKQLHVRCICCGLEKDARPVHLTATVCKHKQNIEPRYCKCCGELIPYDSKTKPADYKRRNFCSSSCAAKVNNKRQHSEVSKLKASETMLAHYYVSSGETYKAKLRAKQQHMPDSRSTRNTSKYYVEDLVTGVDFVVCPYCQLRFGQIQPKHLKLHNKSLEDLYEEFGKDYKTISDISYNKKVKAGVTTQQKLIANGQHKGWQSRNIISYAEQFWINVLDSHNIVYEREAPVWNGRSNYFLDFRLERNGKLIDLEIDGKQHTYEERAALDKIRDAYLQSVGYIVYRIPWNDIKTDTGKQAMQQKINQFLDFYLAL